MNTAMITGIFNGISGISAGFAAMTLGQILTYPEAAGAGSFTALAIFTSFAVQQALTARTIDSNAIAAQNRKPVCVRPDVVIKDYSPKA